MSKNNTYPCSVILTEESMPFNIIGVFSWDILEAEKSFVYEMFGDCILERVTLLRLDCNPCIDCCFSSLGSVVPALCVMGTSFQRSGCRIQMLRSSQLESILSIIQSLFSEFSRSLNEQGPPAPRIEGTDPDFFIVGYGYLLIVEIFPRETLECEIPRSGTFLISLFSFWSLF